MQPVKKYLLAVLIPVFSLMSAGYIYLLHEHAQFDSNASIITGFTLASIQTLAIWGMLLLINSYPTRVGIITYAFFIAAVFSILIYFTDISFLKWYGNTDARSAALVSNIGYLHFAITWILCSWVATNVALHKRNTELRKQLIRQADASALHREAELFKLRQQLQPHFLYNSLNSISALTMIEPAKAQEMIGRLSEFLRSSVKREAQDHILIDEELAYIEAYLAIESIRFGNRLNVIFEKECTADATIPPFLLQPVLENAIKFGLYGKTGDVEIKVNIMMQDSMLVISISNPYDPQTQMPKGTGFGLEGIRRRLYLLFARTDLLETSQENGIFTTIFKIPQHV
jgi:two-component system LytT family sensor kinase